MKSSINVVSLSSDTWQIQDGEGGSCTYLYLLAGQKKAMLIDTGFGAIDALKIVSSLTDKPVFVANTHGHLDHISANHQFTEAYLHPADEPVFAEHSSYEVRRGFVEELLAEQGQPASLLDTPDMREQFKNALMLPQRENRHAMRDGMVFDLGGRHVKVFETPGHTLGSVCLLDEEHRWLFTGDTVCDQGVLLHFPHSASVQVFFESIEKLQTHGYQYDAMWPGHHRCPLEKDILSKYLDCAKRIIQGDKGLALTSAAGTAQMLPHEGIALSFPVSE